MMMMYSVCIQWLYYILINSFSNSVFSACLIKCRPQVH